MSILLATLCLNEMEWLPKLYEQHKNWPGLTKWVFVEAADRQYANANPNMVTTNGLSIDGTSEWLQHLSKTDDRVVYKPRGFSNHSDPAQGKCQARQVYMDIANIVKPTVILTLDADEFYTYRDQEILNGQLYKKINCKFGGFIIPYYNVWRPPSIAHEPLFQWEIRGKLWQVCVCKFWNWQPGIEYRNNHNSPECNGVLLNRSLQRWDRKANFKSGFVHLGFASDPKTRLAKNRYYVERGEGRTDHRGNYVVSRAAFETWQPGDKLPNNDYLIPFTQKIPEVFLNDH